MKTKNSGLLPIAVLSLVVGGFAAIILTLEMGRLEGAKISDGSSAVRELRGVPVLTMSGETRGRQSERLVIGGNPLVVEALLPETERVQLAFVPRLKPRQRPDNIPIVSTIDPGAVYLAPSDPVAIATQDDFTGGRESLFAAYAQAQAEDRAESAYMTVVLNRGEDLAQTLLALGAREEETAAILAAAAEVTDLSALRSGRAIEYAFEPEPRPIVPGDATDAAQSYDLALVRLRFRPDNRHVVTAWGTGDGQYTARIEELEIQKRYAAVAGVINHSLFMAGSRSDVPPEIMQRFANLFLYDIDFARDIFAGDRFEAVYEALYDEGGQYVGTGEIVFAAMTWRGKTDARNYYRFDDAKGMEMPYFDATGESATRLLMKTPIEGARVTSGFGRRKHPILGYTKGHKGVDFGAPRGTPIMAAGDGVIERAAPTGTYGNYIKIKHAHGFETAYAHLRGFAKGIKSGGKVRQGQIIGYVGTTGRSTGPHLHYEVLKSGDVVNPMTLDVANGRVLDGDLFEDFKGKREFVDTLRVHPYTIAAVSTP